MSNPFKLSSLCREFISYEGSIFVIIDPKRLGRNVTAMFVKETQILEVSFSSSETSPVIRKGIMDYLHTVMLYNRIKYKGILMY